MPKLCFLLFIFCFLASAENVKLYLKDGSYQLVREYKIENDRVSFYSLDREDWEEVPASLVDLDKTKAEIKSRADSKLAEATAEDAENKAERAARKEVAAVPKEPGVYLIDEDKPSPDNLTSLKIGESKVVTNKRRSILKAISPVPLVPGKATLELDGSHAPQGTANRSVEFYIRLSDEERFGIVRMGEHKGNRIVEKLTIQPVVNETTQEPDLVEVFRQQVGDGLFKIWPQKPLEPGEYAVVQYSMEKIDMQVWDFFIAPGTGQPR
ncbi:MAG TPA: hypothetical protein VK708_00030 [Bryobacteraceae bacterium]|jgi:hypothetical protein|nr:hypothetical protein [Bryobacteraceae bacterium]